MGESQMKILIVEDEKRLAATLCDIIINNNDMVDVCHDGKTGLEYALSGIYDAIVLDVMLPEMNGFEVIQELRQNKDSTPILLLTAKTELEDRVTGLNHGADYYLTKPFDTPELIACLKAITRRGNEIVPEDLTYGDIIVRVSTGELIREDRSVNLGAKELELIRLLIANKSILLSKEQIYLKIWGYDGNADDNIVEVYISFLRRKLEHVKSNVKISVVRRLGYRLEGGEK